MADQSKALVFGSGIRLTATLLLLMLSGMMPPTVASGQEATDAASNIEPPNFSDQYIPSDAIAVIYYPFRELLTAPAMEWLPIEIAQAQMLETVGVDIQHIEQVKVVIGMPSPSGPLAGVAIELNQDYAISDLKLKQLPIGPPEQVDGLTVYPIMNGPPGTVLYREDARHFFLALGGYLKPMLEAPQDSGPLSKLVANLKQRDGVTAIIVMEQIRPIVSGMLTQQAAKLPPALRDLTKIPDLTDAMLINMDYALYSGSLTLSMLARDEAAAVEMERSLVDAIEFGKQLAIREVKQNIEATDNGPVEQATLRYVDRISDKIVALVQPQRSNRRVQLNLQGNVGTTGVLVGLLLPAVQAAREAARRTSASNGLKQIGLAMHNHHAAFRTLPDRAIRDEAGSPLLSWRVKILPFLDERELYQQFHLDEPWDSPHNVKLLEQMPASYVDPSVPAAPGHTVFQAVVGQEAAFPESGQHGFRDFIDGTSNTIMIVETSPTRAVPWTKPDDFSVDANDPLANLGGSHPGGFQVLFADGAVRFIADSVDPELLRKLFTPSGREVIDQPF